MSDGENHDFVSIVSVEGHITIAAEIDDELSLFGILDRSPYFRVSRKRLNGLDDCRCGPFARHLVFGVQESP